MDSAVVGGLLHDYVLQSNASSSFQAQDHGSWRTFTATVDGAGTKQLAHAARKSLVKCHPGLYPLD